MPRQLPPIPDFSPIFDGKALTPVRRAIPLPVRPAPLDPMAAEIRRINSAHQPEVQEIASDEVLGREIVDADARELATQKKSVRRQQRRRTPGST